VVSEPLGLLHLPEKRPAIGGGGGGGAAFAGGEK